MPSSKWTNVLWLSQALLLYGKDFLLILQYLQQIPAPLLGEKNRFGVRMQSSLDRSAAGNFHGAQLHIYEQMIIFYQYSFTSRF